MKEQEKEENSININNSHSEEIRAKLGENYYDEKEKRQKTKEKSQKKRKKITIIKNEKIEEKPKIGENETQTSLHRNKKCFFYNLNMKYKIAFISIIILLLGIIIFLSVYFSKKKKR